MPLEQPFFHLFINAQRVIININIDNDDYQTELCHYFQKITQTLESYNIKGLLGRKYKNHPNLEFTIYLNNGDIVEYRSVENGIGDIDLNEYKEIAKGWFLFQGKR